MSNLKRLLAGACWAIFWSGNLLSAEPPMPFSPQTQTEVGDFAQRMDQLQQRLERLEAENGQLKQLLLESQPGTPHGVTPASAERWPADTNCPSACHCPVCAAEKNGNGDWKTGWNHGIEWISPDKAFKVHIGGRTQFEGVWYQNNPTDLAGAGGATPPGQDALTFRRARLRADGTIYETIDYVMEFDFVNSLSREKASADNTELNTANIPAPTDLWFNFTDLPLVGNLRVGNFKEPIGFEHATSSRFLNFLERSYLQDLFAGPFNNGFSPGVLIFDSWGDDSGMWYLAGVKNNYFNVFGFDVGDGGYAADARVTYTPIFDEHEHQVLHLGLSGSVRDPDQGLQRFRARSLRNGPANLATVFADTGFFTSSQQWLAGAELAGVYGSWSMQAEWIGSWSEDAATLAGADAAAPLSATRLSAAAASMTPLGTVYTHSYYAELHYFLTGETREYERKNGAFGRVVPKKNFRWKDGCFQSGAWQLAFRYGACDLRDGILNGGQLHEYVAGVNWFLNPNMKIQWNYVATVRDFNTVTPSVASVNDGVVHGFGMRLAHDF